MQIYQLYLNKVFSQSMKSGTDKNETEGHFTHSNKGKEMFSENNDLYRFLTDFFLINGFFSRVKNIFWERNALRT